MAAALTLNARLNVWSSTMLGLILTSNFSTDSFFFLGGGFCKQKAGEVCADLFACHAGSYAADRMIFYEYRYGEA